MLTCNVSNVSSILFNHTSSHDSHTEVHQPASISNSTTSHHTSPGHHLYEGDLVSKTSNLLNEFSISSNWDLGLDFSGGGEKIIGCPIPQSKLFFVFSSPPLSRGGARQGHHTSPGHHLYEGDLVSKTSNLNEFSISSNWDVLWYGTSAKQRNDPVTDPSHYGPLFGLLTRLPGNNFVREGDHTYHLCKIHYELLIEYLDGPKKAPLGTI